jgi:class 3 adenylate cyclase
MSSTETAAILMTDLVGSTGLATRIGPAAAERLRREHFELLREAISICGGREVKSLGDGLMVALPSASSAVGCAVAMQQQIERRNRRSGEQLAIRVGLSVGDVTHEENDYFGTPVVEAARLCERAGGGQILARDLIAPLAGERGGHSFTALDALELKGLPEPVGTVEVGWKLDEAASLPLPPRLQELPAVGFVGRGAERGLLRVLFDEASEGQRRLALVSGEPGIGKTRLCSHAALEARAKGAAVLYGRAEEELSLPYGPWLEALSHYVEHAPAPVLQDHVASHGGELARLVPALRDRVADVPQPRETDPDTERYLLWGAVVGLLRAAAADLPFVLVLDDLHWADKPTLLLLRYVAAQGQGMRALVLATYRESDLAAEHPLTDTLAALHREQGVERLALEGLGEPEIVEIMERAAGHELDKPGLGLSRELFLETDGNPFYTGELLRHLLESGAIHQERESGRWSVRGSLSELALPQSVREVIGQRARRLGEDAQRALQVAAVIGRDFDLELLLRATEKSEDRLLELLEQAIAASVLGESASVPGRFFFAHALIGHTLYEELSTTRRARLHRRVAETLEDLCGGDPGARVGELARHWAKAATTASDVRKAITYARLAAERALSELAPDEAVRWFHQALELQDEQSDIDVGERCELLIGLGEAQRQAGEAAFRETLLEASRVAFELEDADRAARAALANSRGTQSTFGTVDEERLVALDRALELDRFANPARCARLMLLQALELLTGHDHERRRALAEEALALARDAGDPHTLAYTLRDSALALWGPDAVDLTIALVDELLEKATEVGDPALEFWGAYYETQISALRGDLERADAALVRERGLADELGQPTLHWFTLYMDAGVALLRGDLAEAERLAGEGLQVGNEAGQPDAFMIYGSQLAMIRLYQGRGGELVALVEESAEANPGLPVWQAGLAQLYCWVGRTAEAATIVERAAADRFAHVPHDFIRLTTLAIYADAASQAGVREAAAPLYELMEPWADQIVWNGAITYGDVRTYLGLLAATLGWDERADEHFSLACGLQERNGLLLWAARARLGWAEALARRGERERAGAEAGRALKLASEHGYGAIERRAGALLKAGAAAPS